MTTQETRPECDEEEEEDWCVLRPSVRDDPLLFGSSVGQPSTCRPEVRAGLSAQPPSVGRAASNKKASPGVGFGRFARPSGIAKTTPTSSRRSPRLVALAAERQCSPRPSARTPKSDRRLARATRWASALEALPPGAPGAPDAATDSLDAFVRQHGGARRNSGRQQPAGSRDRASHHAPAASGDGAACWPSAQPATSTCGFGSVVAGGAGTRRSSFGTVVSAAAELAQDFKSRFALAPARATGSAPRPLGGEPPPRGRKGRYLGRRP